MEESAISVTVTGDRQIKPKPFNCFKSNCASFVEVVIFARTYHLCAECAIAINTLVSCPKADPYPDRPVKKVQHGQSKEAMKREIKRAEIRRDARNYQSYSSNIEDLLKRYKK